VANTDQYAYSHASTIPYCYLDAVAHSYPITLIRSLTYCYTDHHAYAISYTYRNPNADTGTNAHTIAHVDSAAYRLTGRSDRSGTLSHYNTNPSGHCDSYRYAVAYRHANSISNCYPYAYRHSYSYTLAHSYINIVAHFYSDSTTHDYADGYLYTFTHCYRYALAYSYINSVAHSYPNSLTHNYADGIADRQQHCCAHSHTEPLSRVLPNAGEN
jgi:hypothetical protein